MSYATSKEFLIKYDPEAIGLPSDDTGGSEAVENVVTQFLDDASAFVDTYLRNRYTLPLSTPYDKSLRRAVMIIAKYDIEHRRGGPLSEKEDAEYEAIIAWLEMIAKGEADLGNATVQTSTATYMDSETPIYTEDKFTAYG